ncbi:MAG: hypothetical protein ACJ0DD_04265 [Paracoccaceae bacterium]
MIILNISIISFLIGLGLFSYNIYERSIFLKTEEKNLKNDSLIKDNNSKKLELSKNDKNLLDFNKNLDSELSERKLEIKQTELQKNALDNKIIALNLTKEEIESELFYLKLEISKKKLNLLKEKKSSEQKNQVKKAGNNDFLIKENSELLSKIQKKENLILEMENLIKELKGNIKVNQDNNQIITKFEFDDLKKKNEIFIKNNKKYEKIIKKQKEQILELKSANLIFEKELKLQKKENIPQKNSDGITATFTGNLLYEPNKKRILLIALDGTQYTILQDDFPGDLVAKCGLPISTNSKNRCIATILAELIVEGDQLILKGKEIKEITKNK